MNFYWLNIYRHYTPRKQKNLIIKNNDYATIFSG